MAVNRALVIIDLWSIEMKPHRALGLRFMPMENMAGSDSKSEVRMKIRNL
jgi:hypothetical protein